MGITERKGRMRRSAVTPLRRISCRGRRRWREGKGNNWEGATREPFVMRWPPYSGRRGHLGHADDDYRGCSGMNSVAAPHDLKRAGAVPGAPLKLYMCK
jgi:hypothetical protein